MLTHLSGVRLSAQRMSCHSASICRCRQAQPSTASSVLRWPNPTLLVLTFPFPMADLDKSSLHYLEKRSRRRMHTEIVHVKNTCKNPRGKSTKRSLAHGIRMKCYSILGRRLSTKGVGYIVVLSMASLWWRWDSGRERIDEAVHRSGGSLR